VTIGLLSSCLAIDTDVPVTRSEAKTLTAWTLRQRVRIPLKACVFDPVFMCCPVHVEAFVTG
jgi:hypothetical protein